MARCTLKWIVLSVVFLFLIAGCATQESFQKAQPPFEPVDLNPVLKSGKYMPKVVAFSVIHDASGSMDEPYKGRQKLESAKGLAAAMNNTIPDMKLTGALRMFGRTGVWKNEQTKLLYGPSGYTETGFSDGLGMITRARGESPLHLAIEATAGDFAGEQGNLALIIFSDGKEMGKAPVKAAQALKDRYGDRLCIYTVAIGDDEQGALLLKEVAKAGGCGFSTSGDRVSTPAGMAEFVEQVFLTGSEDSDGDGVPDRLDKCPGTPKGVKVDAVGCPLDTDGDGVYDYLDKCPGTPKGVKVDEAGCPLDTDGDGVYDYLDKCPGTPKGVKVDEVGCPLDTDGDGVYDYLDKCPGTPKGATVNSLGCWVLKGVHFDTNKSDIKPRYQPVLDEVVAVLKENPDLKVEIQGHTDNRGSAEYNMQLSQRRADSVREYMINRGIEADRLRARGYGLHSPAVPNTSPENMAMNRRVQLNPIE